MRIDHATDKSIQRSRVRLQCIGAMGWLGVAGASGTWMLHGGGIARPLSTFAVCIALLSFVLIRTLAMASTDASIFGEVALALRCTGYSVIALMLGTLFLEYWPVTVTMAFMFAICRSFKRDETSAYI